MTSITSNYNLPILSGEGGLSDYLIQIKKFPMLEREEEYMLAKNWRNRGDIKSAEKLVTSHLRLVAKIAMGYRGYGLPIGEMISEGNVGLMQAVKKFDPEKGFRLATYAMWWIKAGIQEYILRSWSLVKMGTTTAQKKLFFNLKKLKNKIAPRSDGDLKDEHVTEIANRLDVKKDEVISMNRRLSGQELSLNAPVGEDGDEWQDWLADKSMDQELSFAHNEEMKQRKDLLENSLEIIPTSDTAGSVKTIKGLREDGVACIASKEAAKIFDIPVIQEGIEDNANNYTRFLIFSKEKRDKTEKSKTSIIFSIKHESGALYQIINEFYQQKINLTKIESRPNKNTPWEYNFYVDFEGHQDDSLTKDVLQKLRNNSTFLKILGSYPIAKLD